MNTLFSSARTPSEQELRRRIFNVLPAASFQFDRLLQLLDIVESDLSPTACVECSVQPRLHLNPAFVAEHCRHDEHLFLLILHELYHVILGHTRLFPRATPLHNLVFDAVINSLLSHQFPEPIYLSFFQGLNPWDSFPGRLLRPPPGWPDAPEPLPLQASRAEKVAMDLLYGPAHSATTYHDVFKALITNLSGPEGESGTPCNGYGQKHGTNEDKAVTGVLPGPEGNTEITLADCVLLGDHSGREKDGAYDDKAVGDDLLKQVFRRIVEGWPPPRTPIAGRDEGRKPGDFLLPRGVDPQAPFKKALRRLLARAGILKESSHVTRRSPAVVACRQGIQTVLPDLRDRRAPAFEKLWGRRPILFQTERLQARRILSPRDTAFVYLDVSGSMTESLPILGAALWKPHRDGEVRLFVFSTVVDEANPRRPLSMQGFRNSGGTEINCVLDHLLNLPRKSTPRRVVLLTDGYTGCPRQDLIGQLEARGVSLFVGLVGPNSSNELRPYAKHIEQLPAFLSTETL